MLASKSCLLIENIESFSKSFDYKDIMLLEDRREISKYSNDNDAIHEYEKY